MNQVTKWHFSKIKLHLFNVNITLISGLLNFAKGNTQMTNNEFIELIGKYAVKHYEKYKILPSLTIAQAILESNWGKSKLSAVAFNYFGMKAGSTWTGATYSSKTNEQTPAGQNFTVNADFRAYKNTDEGIKGYYEFLQYNRYKNLKGVIDYKRACALIKEDGWATDILYTSKLINLIEKYYLYKYDEKAMGDDEMIEEKALWIDGKEYKNIKQINKDGKIFAAISDFKQADYNVGWNGEIKTASISKAPFSIGITIESVSETRKREVESILVNGSNYCKLRDITDLLSQVLENKGIHMTVGFDQASKTPKILIE